jgi:fructose-1,6-bisphosphatase/inositol monophosphatase family enzyme
MPTVDIARVAAIVREVAEAEILPRWRNLAADDIGHKSHKGDIVTVADREAEIVLARRLTALLPGSVAVGEEAVFADQGILERFAGDSPVWVLDPVDGTRAFAEGRPDFDVLVGLVVGGEPVAGWIFAPAEDDLYLGEIGGGVVREQAGREAERVAAPVRHHIGELSGIVTPQYFLNRRLPDPRPALQQFRGYVRHACAGHNYARLLRGDQDFLINFTTPPWDHLPGLALTQAGGWFNARHDGRPFRPLDPKGGILVAPDPASWRAILDALVPSHLRAGDKE